MPTEQDLEKNSTSPNSRSLGVPRSPRRRPALYLLMFLLGGSIALLGSYWVSHNPGQIAPSSNVPALIAPATTPSNPSPANLPVSQDANWVSNVVDRVGAAVVRIDSSKTVTSQAPNVFTDPALRQFFGGNGSVPSQKEVVRGVGSGFILNN